MLLYVIICYDILWYINIYYDILYYICNISKHTKIKHIMIYYNILGYIPLLVDGQLFQAHPNQKSIVYISINEYIYIYIYIYIYTHMC